MQPIKFPNYRELLKPTFYALKELGGSGKIDEIYMKVLAYLQLPSEVIEMSHLGSTNQTELEYQLAWARTYLKNYGIITNSSRGVWAITPEFSTQSDIDDPGVIIRRVTQNGSNKIGNSDNNYPKGNNKDEDKPEDENPENDNIEFPDEFKPWKQQLSDVLLNMDPYAFERLTQRLLRECGFTSVNVTKKSNDGGIDGTGRLCPYNGVN